MARPKKQTVDYYPHMAKSGKTLYIIENRWGNDGYAFFHKLLELLCSTDGHVIDYGNPAEKEFLLAKTHVNDETATGILNLLADLGKIDKALWESGLIWYQNLVDNIKDAYKKRTLPVPEKPKLKSKLTINEFPTSEILQPDESASDNPQTKLNETKLNNTPIVPFNGGSIANDCIDYQGVIDEYNSTCVKMPKAETLNRNRRGVINGRLKDHGREAITEVFRFASQSPHHNGNNDLGWKADFDWLMGPKNFVKILERARSGTMPGQIQNNVDFGLQRFYEKHKGGVSGATRNCNGNGNNGKGEYSVKGGENRQREDRGFMVLGVSEIGRRPTTNGNEISIDVLPGISDDKRY